MGRKTPPDDPERIADAIWSDSGGTIRDREDFNDAWGDFMGGGLSSAQEHKLKPKVWDALKTKHEKTMKAKMGRKTVIRRTVKPHVVLKEQVTYVPGRVKGKVRYVREDYVFRQEKQYKIYRDRQGHFAKALK
jgi:hypothetical protein